MSLDDDIVKESCRLERDGREHALGWQSEHQWHCISSLRRAPTCRSSQSIYVNLRINRQAMKPGSKAWAEPVRRRRVNCVRKPLPLPRFALSTIDPQEWQRLLQVRWWGYGSGHADHGLAWAGCRRSLPACGSTGGDSGGPPRAHGGADEGRFLNLRGSEVTRMALAEERGRYRARGPGHLRIEGECSDAQ